MYTIVETDYKRWVIVAPDGHVMRKWYPDIVFAQVRVLCLTHPRSNVAIDTRIRLIDEYMAARAATH